MNTLDVATTALSDDVINLNDAGTQLPGDEATWANSSVGQPQTWSGVLQVSGERYSVFLVLPLIAY